MCFNKKRAKTISFLLGAGFSMPIGFPSGDELGKRIYETSEEELQSVIEERVVLDQDRKCLQIIKNFIDIYKKDIKKDFDYEDFYDILCGAENNTIGETHDLLFECDLLFQKLLKYHLKPRSLSVKCPACLYGDFSLFLKELSKDYQINIHTLNHDTLLEDVFCSENIDFDDGFCESCDNSFYHNANDKQLVAHYINYYSKNVRLYKLHGSTNYYECGPNGSGKVETIIKLKTRKGIVKTSTQELNDQYKIMYTGYTPLFLTGLRTKIKDYDFYPFKNLFDIFSKNVRNSEKVIIIGYSGRDMIINSYLSTIRGNIYIIDPKAVDVTKTMGINSHKQKEKSISELNQNELMNFIFQ